MAHVDIHVDDHGRRYLEVRGHRVYIAADEDLDRAAFIVCGDASYFPDDVRALCGGCGRVVFHRPYLPTDKPRVCFRCVIRFAAAPEC
jgi:hypothetical protein